MKSVMEFLVSKAEIADQGNEVRLSSHKVRLKEEEKDLKDKISELIVQGRNAPPLFKELVAAGPCRCETDPGNCWDPRKGRPRGENQRRTLLFKDFIEETKIETRGLHQPRGGTDAVTVPRDHSSSRKYNIPLLEYLRNGRVLR